jgi:hypothetical protein
VRKLLAALALAAMALPAADVSGIWLGSTTTGRRGQVLDFAFHFVQKDSALTGKVYLDYGTTPILKGTVEGEKISFEIVAREQNGNEINESTFTFTGVMKDGAIEMKRERQGMRNAGNAGTAVSRAGELTFQIKRLP